MHRLVQVVLLYRHTASACHIGMEDLSYIGFFFFCYVIFFFTELREACET